MKHLFIASLLLAGIGFCQTVEADGSIMAARDLELSQKQVDSVMAGRDLSLSNTHINGKLSAGRHLSCIGCTISGSASAGQSVSLSNSTVEQDVSAGQSIEAINSIIKGNLSLGGNYLRLDHVTANTIRFAGIPGGGTGIMSNSIMGNGNNISTGGGGIVINSNGGNFMVGNRQGSANVNLGNNSISSVNGYLIKSSGGQTTLITPDQRVYINGRKVSGPGPARYQDYRLQTAGAPLVNAPGWNETSGDKQETGKSAAENKTVVNTLELVNNSVLQGDVVFESGYGKILVAPGSIFTGRVTNGLVEKHP